MEKNQYDLTKSNLSRLKENQESNYRTSTITKAMQNEEIFCDENERTFQRDYKSSLGRGKSLNITNQGGILSEKRQPLQPKSEQEKTNIEENFISDFCEICSEDLIPGEVVNFCLCEKFYHPNCLIFSLSTNNNISKSCEECQSNFNFGNYKHSNQTDSTLEKTLCNVSLIDTNINNLENYDEMRDMAFQMNHDGFAQVISKKSEASLNNTNSLNEEINRIALSPIVLTSTPYSGKTKKQISSNQKVEEYLKLQNTHTTPYNHRHINISDLSEVPQVNPLNYEQSPETSFQGIRQHLTFCSPNNPNFTTTHGKSLHGPGSKIESDPNFDIDKFFKTINCEISSVGHGLPYDSTNNSNLNNQISFRKIVFDEAEEESANVLEREGEEFDDKENTPPVPRESSRFSYKDPEVCSSLSPVEINIEAGISHIISDTQRIVEVPISIDFKLKDNFLAPVYSKDYVVIINAQSLNSQTVCQIFKVLYEKIGDCDRIFTNILRVDRWITKDEIKEILKEGNFENFIQSETAYLNYSEVSRLVTYCIDLSFESQANIFSVILINDLEEIEKDVDCYEELKQVSQKLKESKVNLMKNFTINCVILDHGKIEESKAQNYIKFFSFFYELTMLSMGFFFAPKDFNELNKSIVTVFSIIDQSSMLNLKANIKGNKDPSIYLEVSNYPSFQRQHNHFEIYLGSLMKKERKFLCLTAIVILNNQNVTMNLPLLEVNLEFLSLKNREHSFNYSNSSFNLYNHSLNLMASLIRNKTPCYQISIPIINKNKEVNYSYGVTIRHCAAKIADVLKETLNLLRQFKLDECLNKLSDCKSLLEQTIKSQPSLIKYLRLHAENNNTSSININMNNVHFLNSRILNSTNMNNSISHDDSMSDVTRSVKNSKIFNFCFLLLSDLNNLIEVFKQRNLSFITELYTIAQSLMFYRPVHLSDDRFFDDVIDQF